MLDVRRHFFTFLGVTLLAGCSLHRTTILPFTFGEHGPGSFPRERDILRWSRAEAYSATSVLTGHFESDFNLVGVFKPAPHFAGGAPGAGAQVGLQLLLHLRAERGGPAGWRSAPQQRVHAAGFKRVEPRLNAGAGAVDGLGHHGQGMLAGHRHPGDDEPLLLAGIGSGLKECRDFFAVWTGDFGAFPAHPDNKPGRTDESIIY